MSDNAKRGEVMIKLWRDEGPEIIEIGGRDRLNIGFLSDKLEKLKSKKLELYEITEMSNRFYPNQWGEHEKYMEDVGKAKELLKKIHDIDECLSRNFCSMIGDLKRNKEREIKELENMNV